MNDCLRHLATQPECENDEILVVLTKCLSILDDVFSSSTWGSGDRQAYTQLHDQSPPTLLIKALLRALDEVIYNIRPPLLEKSMALPLQFNASPPSKTYNFEPSDQLTIFKALSNSGSESPKS